jgi:hypothetical protein
MLIVVRRPPHRFSAKEVPGFDSRLLTAQRFLEAQFDRIACIICFVTNSQAISSS